MNDGVLKLLVERATRESDRIEVEVTLFVQGVSVLGTIIGPLEYYKILTNDESFTDLPTEIDPTIIYLKNTVLTSDEPVPTNGLGAFMLSSIDGFTLVPKRSLDSWWIPRSK